MFLFKRGSYYHVYYNDKNGKRKNLSTKTKSKKEAIKFLTNFNKELKKREDQEVEPITLGQFRWETLKRLETTNTDKSVKVYKTTFRYLLEHFGNIQLTEITRPKVQTYLHSRIMSASVYMARKDLINMKAAFNNAVENNYLKVNPCSGIRQFKLPEKQPLFLSKEDYQKLLNVIDDKDFKDLVEVAVNTGMRQMELLTLTWGMINFNDKLIILDNRNHITKSKKVRSLPMNITVSDILFRRQLTTPKTVFHYLNTYKQDRISHIFKSYVIVAGLNPKLHFHSLRHTFASWLVQKDVSIYYISKLLGHANIKTTEIYAHIMTCPPKSAPVY